MQQSGTDELLAIFLTEHSPNHRTMVQFNTESFNDFNFYAAI